jgi:sorbitol-specific phosphotransferase system component IIC
MRRLDARFRALRKAVTAAGAIVAFSAPAAACPYCALSQGIETLAYVLGFLAIPYLIVTGVWFWMRRVIATEHDG